MSKPSTSRKRKSDSDAPTDTSAKKARLMVDAILADASNYPIPADDADARDSFIVLAKYARSLEEMVSGSKPKELSPEELEAAAEKLRVAARSGIKKQMTWKPSCKTGGSKWTYDGVCNNPAVFGTMLRLGGPPTFKTKKLTADEFQNIMGVIQGHARYNTLYMRGNVNIQWKADEGTFKFSGTHGV
ncbi:hypothetical protein E1B28_012106 [Marasmius oreades]|uniref:Uncharacterized protein n=1 Tax=Marasmius oreades TaxID=181124 RepID=A0A9P7RRN1_9AGAR|nr:uncharacterized protein E1B28_012106 [Marasmius oreades]KAG7088075.1 hypothetical protein E1B28_012106 [Marasmius oreades]